YGVAVADSNGAGVSGELLELELSFGALGCGGVRVGEDRFERGPALGVVGGGAAAVVVAGVLRRGRHQRSSRKSTCSRSAGSYLRITSRSGLFRRFFRVT